MNDSPVVDAVIAVHDETRPIARAVESLTRSGLPLGTDLRITVVCHNLPTSAVERQLKAFPGSGVRLLSLEDGIRSPAGPFNAGIQAATGRYVSIMGSDDYLEPGALASWAALGGSGAEAVIAPQVHQSGATVRTPPVRRFHRGDLDPVKDRLTYRTAPLGLVARSAIDRLGLQFSPGLSTGEDQLFSARLWFAGRRLRYAAGSPRYVVGADAGTRVTTTPRPLRDVFAFLERLLSDAWFRSLDLRSRRAIAVKTVRVHFLDSVRVRIEAGAWTPEDEDVAVAIANRLCDSAPGFERALAVADRRALDAVIDRAPTERIAELARARRRFGLPSTLVTRDPSSLFAVDAPLRFMIASALV